MAHIPIINQIVESIQEIDRTSQSGAQKIVEELESVLEISVCEHVNGRVNNAISMVGLLANDIDIEVEKLLPRTP